MKTFIEVVGGLLVLIAAALFSASIVSLGVAIVTNDENFHTIAKQSFGVAVVCVGLIIPMYVIYKAMGWKV